MSAPWRSRLPDGLDLLALGGFALFLKGMAMYSPRLAYLAAGLTCMSVAGIGFIVRRRGSRP